MFLVPSQQPQHHAIVGNCPSLPRASSKHQLRTQSPGAKFGSLLNASDSSMERSVHEYSQSDHASAAPYPSNPEARTSSYSTSATPTSEYGAYPQSARSTSSFPEHSLRHYHPASNHSGSSGGMAQQTPTSPSLPLQDGRSHQSPQVKSDTDVPIDPSIAAPSPTTYAAHGQYSPYAPPPQDMSHSYPQSAGNLYTQRPDWANYGQAGAGHMPHPHQMPFPPHTPTTGPPGRPAQYGVQQVYSFVPIPGAQQHKRPRRRYEEIERMYKCGWNGCEKAYGTLNHLNAHVTMQSHGTKRTPEEFKEIRKEWKARKKEEEQQRKAAEEQERSRQAQAVAAAAAQAQNGGEGGDANQTTPSYTTTRQVQLPPIGYGQQASYPAPPSATVPQQPLPEYSPYGGSYQPPSPYAPQGQQMYSQRD
ncbi:hypothetical protein GGR56DRAFT_283657 [Xylariaceae sp. FL0804]|nr:hypothetical protein GGR56DRAFT_283657 [Xylariaceae sp. FL0804]